MDMKLPAIDEIVFALGELPLGEGNEARVYKIHTNPKFTVRVAKDRKIENMTEYLYNTLFLPEKDVFEGRNFAQTVGYFLPPKGVKDPFVTVNLYCPGFSFELNRDYLSKMNAENADSQTTLIKTRLLTEKLLELPDEALEKTFDDMKFLSSKRYSLDSGGGYFMNTGNILYSEVDKKLFIIDSICVGTVFKSSATLSDISSIPAKISLSSAQTAAIAVMTASCAVNVFVAAMHFSSLTPRYM